MSRSINTMAFVASGSTEYSLSLIRQYGRFADGACEGRSRREEESMRLDLGSVALPTKVTVLMKVII